MASRFDEAFEALSSDARRLYGVLAPIDEGLNIEVAAAALGMGVPVGERLVGELVHSNLLHERPGGGVGWGDDVRAHALTKAAQIPADQVRAGVGRAAAWYLHRLAAAQVKLNPTRNYVSPQLRDQAATGPAVTFTDDRQALESMQQALPAVRALLTAEPPYQLPAGIGWQLVEALWNLFLHRRLIADWIPLHTLGHADAVAAGHQRGAARMLEGIAAGHNHRGEHDRALQVGRQALELERRIGHAHGQIAALDVLGVAYLAQGRPAQARGHFTEALSIADTVGHRHGAALMRRHLGECDAAEGRHTSAVGHYDNALGYYQAGGARYAEERVRFLRARSLLSIGHLTEAEADLHHARNIAEAIDAPLELARIDEARADIAAIRDDDPAHTLTLLGQAHARYADCGDPRAAAIQLRRQNLLESARTDHGTDEDTAQ